MPQLVTPDNFNRAESDHYFHTIVEEGGFGEFSHHRELMPVDQQTVVRPNRDTLYSAAVCDLEAGPVTVTLPDPGTRFMSMQIIDEEQFSAGIVYGGGAYTITRQMVGTRYVFLAVRILIDPSNPLDLAEVHALQDAMHITQRDHGRFEVPEWDERSQGRVRDALIELGKTIPDSRGMFGAREQVDSVRHLIGSAIAWGGNAEKDATYVNVTPPLNDGTTFYRLTVGEVPVDGFWSISVYNARGYFEPNAHDAYSINNLTAVKNRDGSVTIQFGWDPHVPNCLPIMPGWNYLVRLYRPRQEILSGAWTFPEADPVLPELDRAVEAAVWGMPIVSFDAMREAYFRDARARYNDIVYWSKPADWKLQITTPNASSRYVYTNFNLADGPVVLEIPPADGAGLFGSILDAWQVPLVDVGPQGEDGGDGARYLLLPPGQHNLDIPGVIPVRLETLNGYAVFRAIAEGTDIDAIDRALDLIHHMRMYPFAAIDNPPVTRFIDMAGKVFDGIVRFDDTYFDRLSRMLDEDPGLLTEPEMRAHLAELGIGVAAGFEPDHEMRQILSHGARTAYRSFQRAAPTDGEVYYDGRQWRWPSAIGAQTGFSFTCDHGVDAAARGLVYFLACAPPARLGKATVYLSTWVDAHGRRFSGDRTYRLHVPPDVPATQFWALTIYDAATAAFIRESPRIEINSFANNLTTNADGSVDLYVGPSAPAGKEANWSYAAPRSRWFTIFRMYGPTEAVFDRRWELPDFEAVDDEARRSGRRGT
jgi:hypothetical protein